MATKETVLVVGATGNIGTSAVMGALRCGRDVLAVVRNTASAEKLFRNVGTREGITTVEADVLSDSGVQGVVDRIRQGELPAFQHVYSTAGGAISNTPLSEVSTAELRQSMAQNFESNFFAYRATFPYLQAQPNPTSFTLCVGGLGDLGTRAAAAMTQGALYSLSAAAAHEVRGTRVRFIELYLDMRVETDESAARTGAVAASDFAAHYAEILERQQQEMAEGRGARVKILNREGLTGLKFVDKEFKL
ncbi:hypothetical protein PFICI_05335 [Pestalotiopsis fici W106-1]|uniref:Uncharacterized protein n=1 Tax=Pestalotiopsis fici (strain W106-1 / CGMCC3.15140) TaxID=1229662 RepID=W3XBQ7_PESFW|nr:uncharacterized protein PFICI_05335 [Pestalotiopsis fici W106-1]ETS83459.1 hypothetical protein PFICI_05335 [Pestalotiopsis fici W106-1]